MVNSSPWIQIILPSLTMATKKKILKAVQWRMTFDANSFHESEVRASVSLIVKSAEMMDSIHRPQSTAFYFLI